MKKTLQKMKRTFAILLAVAMAVTSLPGNGGVVYAAQENAATSTVTEDGSLADGGSITPAAADAGEGGAELGGG
ncbi:MAG: hypothetical protein NC419_09310 [Muribaculaceae bacterium]|nr:hypothetical protein [Muribaculaceae bacterium]